jgi:hypothetical protein
MQMRHNVALGRAMHIYIYRIVLQNKQIETMKMRAKHLLSVLEDQQTQEVEREKRLLAASITGEKAYVECVVALARERFEAADRIMRILDVSYDCIYIESFYHEECMAKNRY